METGLLQLNDKTYYLSESGTMKTGNITVNGQSYTFGASGEKINTATAQSNTTTLDTNKTAGSTSSSGGSGGSSSSSNNNSSNDSYKKLYGTWTVKSHIPSDIKTTLSDSTINRCIGEEFTISNDNIKSIYLTLSNPKVKESTMTASEFNDKFKNTGISGDKINLVNISDNNKSSRSVDVITNNNGQTYALLRGSLFELEKK